MTDPLRTRPCRAWWRDAVIYQIYLRSFADGDGDGVGDLRGLRERLEYLATLGVDGIWINPCYPSPQVDHGYDVAHYTAIEPEYGDLDEFDSLVARAHELGLKVLLDLVPNHCSAEHPWFTAALAAPPGSPERDRFFFRDGRGDHGELPPNNWTAQFGGPAWTRISEPDGTPGQWYLHQFDGAQPDFNWNNPEVVEFFDGVLRFWFDRGIDGFRIDVAHGMVKHPDLPDWHGEHYNQYAWNRPEVHEIHRRWRALADSYAPQRELTLVGEIWVPTVADLARYLRPDELPQAFFFDLLTQPWSAPDWRRSIDRALAEIGATGATVTWTLANHDVHRAVSRYGLVESDTSVDSGDPFAALTRPRGRVDVDLGESRARAALLILLALPGSVYHYQGEELGLPEVLDLPDEHRQDPIWTRSRNTEYGRDGCRVPLPWNEEHPSFGFSPPGAHGAAWLPQPDWYGKYAVDTQLGDTDSTLHLYREALARRWLFVEGGDEQPVWQHVPGREDVLILSRGHGTCVVNFGTRPVRLSDEWGQPVLSSTRLHGPELPGNAACWLSHRGTRESG